MTLEGKVHLPWVNGDALADVVHSFFAGKEPLAPASSPTSTTGCRLDEANRELVLNGRREPTTPLEYGVMLVLIRARGRIVTRDEILAKVWRTSFAGSNKIEAVVRSLRKRLGAFAPSIETITGYGYRFSGWKRRMYASSYGTVPCPSVQRGECQRGRAAPS
jgi:DNA-binding response OmpR family regulator